MVLGAVEELSDLLELVELSDFVELDDELEEELEDAVSLLDDEERESVR